MTRCPEEVRAADQKMHLGPNLPVTADARRCGPSMVTRPNAGPSKGKYHTDYRQF